MRQKLGRAFWYLNQIKWTEIILKKVQGPFLTTKLSQKNKRNGSYESMKSLNQSY